jgi:hypothetical protein
LTAATAQAGIADAQSTFTAPEIYADMLTALEAELSHTTWLRSDTIFRSFQAQGNSTVSISGSLVI